MNSFDKTFNNRQEGSGVLLRRALPLVLSNGLLFLLRIINAIILVRILTQSEYGLYRQYYLLFDTMIMFFWMGLSSSMLYFIPRLSKEQSKPFLSQTLIISSVAGIISFAAIVCAKRPIGIYLNTEIPKHLFLFAGFVSFTISSYFFENLLISEKKTVFSAIFSVLYYLLLFFCTLVVVTITKNASSIFYVLMPLAFFKYLLVVIYSVARYGFTFAIDRSLMKKHLTYCIPLAIAALFHASSFSVDEYMVSALYGSTLFALYAVGSLYLPISELTSSPASLVILPVMARLEKEKNHQDIVDLYREITRKISLVFFPIVIFFMFIAQDLISVLFGKAYVGATPILRFYLLAVIPDIFVAELVFASFAKTKYIWMTRLVILAAIVGFAVLFNPILGYVGIALAFALSRYIGLVFAISKVRMLLALSVQNLLAYGELIKNIFISIVSLLPLVAIRWIARPGTLSFRIINVFVYLLGYLILAYCLKAFKTHDIDSIKSLMQNIFLKRHFDIDQPK